MSDPHNRTIRSFLEGKENSSSDQTTDNKYEVSKML